MDKNQQVPSEEKKDEEVLYTRSILTFLRSKLDDFTIECFRLVLKHHKQGGLMKTKMIDDYFKKRFAYDRSFNILEAQGFIEYSELGNMKLYIVTPRGEQLISILKAEKEAKKEIL